MFLVLEKLILVEETHKQIYTAKYHRCLIKVYIEYIRDTEEDIVNSVGWESIPERN